VTISAYGYSTFQAAGSTYGTAQEQLESDNHRLQCNVMTYQSQNTQTTGPACPTSITVGTIASPPLSQNYPPYKTGIGGFAQMSVGPSNSTTYNGYQITEALSQDSATTCPTILLQQDAFSGVCSGNSTFTVGAALQSNPYNGAPTPPANNAFWDVHTSTDAVDAMGVAGYTTKCYIVCDQTYTCGASQIGTFTITRTITHTTVGSDPAVPVTNVSVSKTAK